MPSPGSVIVWWPSTFGSGTIPCPPTWSRGPSERYVASTRAASRKRPSAVRHARRNQSTRITSSGTPTNAPCSVLLPEKCFAIACAQPAPTASRCVGISRFRRSAVYASGGVKPETRRSVSE